MADNDHHFPGPGTLDRALALVRFLRAECPWDAEQTAESLIPHLLEETHEVVDAIRDGDDRELEGELGDLLLNLAFQIVVAEEEGTLDADSVYGRLEAKMIARHPHVFGDAEHRDWERSKAAERGEEEGVLAGLARGLDPLTKAYRIQERVAGVGFDWEDHQGALEKVVEELGEVREELEEASGESEAVPDRLQQVGDELEEVPRKLDVVRDERHDVADTPRASYAESHPRSGDPESARGYGDVTTSANARRLQEEIGDLLFAVVNLARLTGVHPTTALAGANRKFRTRFERLEAVVAERGIDLSTAGFEVLDGIWEELKEE